MAMTNHTSGEGTGCTKGVVELTQWFERMETVFRISHCSVENQIKFSTCTLLAGREMKKLEAELWNLKVKESDKVERYVSGLPDMIHRSVVASKPKTMQEATEMATELMDKKISTLAERQAKNKRKLDNNNQAQQQSPKRQNVARAYAVGTSDRKEYAGTLPLCNRCKLHHNGPYTVAARNQRNLTCYECGNQGHYRSDCLELKNQNHGNQAEGTKARGMVYALGGGETDQDLNNIEDEIEA
ncbi:RNA-directed DNA polymerase, eukaryota [Tanacetum coccineum]